MEESELLKLINKAFWKKTNYIQPHEYMLRKDYPEAYSALKEKIDKEGYEAKFLGKTYRYVNIEEYRYWAYDTLINRALLSAVST
jgi:hypothetical protein